MAGAIVAQGHIDRAQFAAQVNADQGRTVDPFTADDVTHTWGDDKGQLWLTEAPDLAPMTALTLR